METSQLALYHFEGCPYCMRVYREINNLKLQIERKDIRQSQQSYDELVAGGGKKTVPCLRIQHTDGNVQWLYESWDIVQYLRQNFSGSTQVPLT